MDKINSIEIIINSLNKNINLFIDTKSLTVNNKVIKKGIIDNLIKIICLWKHEYGYSNLIDCEEFTIKIKTSKNIDIYHGKGIYPKNYNEFLKVIGKIYE